MSASRPHGAARDGSAPHLAADGRIGEHLGEHLGERIGAGAAGRADGEAPCAPDAAAWLLTGQVVHERLRPVRHAFRYRLFQIDCDVGRLDALRRRWFGVDRSAPMALWQRDHGPRDGRALDAWLREALAAAQIPADGAIRLQAIPRVFGYAFNPVAFWYCHDRHGRMLALYAEVRNTFGAHHGYLLSAPDHAPIDDGRPLVCRKTFHVSPFCRVEGHYEFRVRRQPARSVVAIDYHDGQGLLLRTAIAMRAEPLTAGRTARALLGQPFGMFSVMVRIHWQALRLALKRVPFFGSAPPSPAALAPGAAADEALDATPEAAEAAAAMHAAAPGEASAGPAPEVLPETPPRSSSPAPPLTASAPHAAAAPSRRPSHSDHEARP